MEGLPQSGEILRQSSIVLVVGLRLKAGIRSEDLRKFLHERRQEKNGYQKYT